MNISGKKVSPIEIEKYINQIPFIKEVACIEKENKRTGIIEIKAFVVLDKKKIANNWSSEIKKYLKNKIEYYKMPSTIVNIDSIPKTYNGKILRTKLKENDKC